MYWTWWIVKRAVFALLVFVGVLLVPVGYTELSCQGSLTEETYDPLIVDPAWQRAESRTLLTYPEWHIVHAYDDYARVIRDGDPHEFAYLPAVVGFWSALCPLSVQAAEMGGISGDTKATIYTIGVSFTAEMLLKGLYEETVGRLVAWGRGPVKTPLDGLSASQAADYAKFLQQTPWYKYDFVSDARELSATATPLFRDRERWLALSVEYRGKALYGGVIEKAVANVGADALRMRSVVTGIDAEALAKVTGVQVIDVTPNGILIETDRYRAFTNLLRRLARLGVQFEEISGNDEILFTAISDGDTEEGAIHSFTRQGYWDYRHLILVPVTELTERIRNLDGLRLEHVHDY
ncbi:MAG: hypothetical protein GKR98_12420 [Boseongicola sp.]|nr:MAG: hypothetical protein GKR98_12420 [Boseongicola sp.]